MIKPTAHFLVSFFSLCIFYCVAVSNAQNDDTLARKKAKVALEKMTADDFKNYYKLNHSRIPQNRMNLSPPVDDTLESHQGLKKNKAVQTVPKDITFPGEFEEVKAILITWPYIFFNSYGQIVYDTQIFKNVAFDFWGRAYNVTSTPDLSTNSEFPPIFAKLAKTIDENAEVWINIFNALDSTLIKNYMIKNNMPLSHVRFFVNQGNSYWYRDCGPVAFYYGTQDSIGFVDFEYYGGRPLDDSIPIKIGQQAGYPVFTTQLEYEGGNILLDGCNNLFTSDEVYKRNADTLGLYKYNSQKKYLTMARKTPLTQQQVRDSLKLLLNLDQLLVLPRLKYDGGTGHIDLYADLWDESNFVFSQMPVQMKNFTDYSTINNNVSVILAFTKNSGDKFKNSTIPLPRKDDGSWYKNDTNYAMYTRTYSNHLFVNKTIIQPVFASTQSGDMADLQKDLDSIKSKYPGYNIIPIDIRAFDGMGGAIHCITKQIPADNPLRIIHLPFSGNTEYKKSYPVDAKIYNRSGIANAQCKWRYKGEFSWNLTQLTPASPDSFSGSIENKRNNDTIEYYLEATSNNGKTMTKPITAPAGFYSFSFQNTSTFTVGREADSKKHVIFIQKFPMKKLFVRTSGFNSDFTMRLFTITGKVVYSHKFCNNIGLYEIDITSINSGTLIAVIQSSDGFTVKEKISITN